MKKLKREKMCQYCLDMLREYEKNKKRQQRIRLRIKERSSQVSGKIKIKK